MKEFFTKINTVATKVTMTAQEKANIRARLVSHVFNNEVKNVPQLSPLSHIFQFSQHISVRYMSLVAVILVVFVGVSGVAQDSLPGESLYQVKTSVNENIRGLFAFTPQSRAQLHVELAVRRLEEAQELASTGKLQDGAKIEVEKKLDEHLAAIKDNLLTLEQQNPGTTTIEVATTTDDTVITIDSSGDAEPAVSLMSISATDIVATSTEEAPATLESKIKDASDDLKAGGNKVDNAEYSEAYDLVKKAEQKTEEIKKIINKIPNTKTDGEDVVIPAEDESATSAIDENLSVASTTATSSQATSSTVQ